MNHLVIVFVSDMAKIVGMIKEWRNSMKIESFKIEYKDNVTCVYINNEEVKGLAAVMYEHKNDDAFPVLNLKFIIPQNYTSLKND